MALKRPTLLCSWTIATGAGRASESLGLRGAGCAPRRAVVRASQSPGAVFDVRDTWSVLSATVSMGASAARRRETPVDRSGANPVRRVRTSPWPRWIARAILIACFQMSAAPSALATVIYEYTGNPFTFAPPLLPQGPGPPAPNPFTTDDFVFGSMTFTNPR